MDAHVAVIGVGSIGSMAAWQLAKAGVDVIGFEQYGLAHDQAAAGGESRIFRTAYLEGPQYVPLLQRAYLLWRQLEEETGQDLLTLNGGLMIGPADSEQMRNVQASIDTFDLAHEVLDASDMARRYPQHRLREGESAILDVQAGVLRPEFAVSAAAYRAQDLGARIYSHVSVTGIEETSSGVTIHTSQRDYAVDQAVVTAGPWTNRFVPALSGHVEPRRLVMTWYRARQLAAYQPGAFPVFIRNAADCHIFGIPTLDGGSVKIARHGDYGRLTDGDQLDHNVAVEDLQPINTIVANLMPGLIPEPVRVAAYMDAYTSDGHGLVGHAPGCERVWVLGGFSGHGFKMAPTFGQIAAELVQHGRTDLPITHLDPARFTR